LEAGSGTKKNFCNSTSIYTNLYSGLACDVNTFTGSSLVSSSCINSGSYSYKFLECANGKSIINYLKGTLQGGIAMSSKLQTCFFLFIFFQILLIF
jgi:hypothetical protein